MERYDPYTDSFIYNNTKNCSYITTDKIITDNHIETIDEKSINNTISALIEASNASNVSSYNVGYINGRKDVYKDIKNVIRSKIFIKMGNNKNSDDYGLAKDTSYMDCINIIDEYLDGVSEPIIDIDE